MERDLAQEAYDFLLGRLKKGGAKSCNVSGILIADALGISVHDVDGVFAVMEMRGMLRRDEGNHLVIIEKNMPKSERGSVDFSSIGEESGAEAARLYNTMLDYIDKIDAARIPDGLKETVGTIQLLSKNVAGVVQENPARMFAVSKIVSTYQPELFDLLDKYDRFSPAAKQNIKETLEKLIPIFKGFLQKASEKTELEIGASIDALEKQIAEDVAALGKLDDVELRENVELRRAKEKGDEKPEEGKKYSISTGKAVGAGFASAIGAGALGAAFLGTVPVVLVPAFAVGGLVTCVMMALKKHG